MSWPLSATWCRSGVAARLDPTGGPDRGAAARQAPHDPRRAGGIGDHRDSRAGATKGDTRWSTRSAAPSLMAMSWTWALGLKPHLMGTWKLSTDRQFIEKVRDVVDLHLRAAGGAWCCAWLRARSGLICTVPACRLPPATRRVILFASPSLFIAAGLAGMTLVKQGITRGPADSRGHR
jgi:hypothetical protein